jgi:hypothetical protein
MTEQSPEDGETEKALTDYQEGMRLRDGVRAADGMRMLKSLDGKNLELMARMFRQDPSLSSLYLHYLDFSKTKGDAGPGSLPSKLNATLVAALAVGDAKAVSNALVEMGKVEDGDLELLANMIEAKESQGPYSIGFVQRRTGPFVDDLKIKAKWFTISNVFKKVFEPGMMKKVAMGHVEDHFKGKKGFGKSSIHKARAYFDYFKKID